MLPPHPKNPLGPDPAWRHLRAVHLVAAGLPADHPRDDRLSREAWRFYLAMNECEGHVQDDALARQTPALVAAHRFFSTAAPLQRAELEARILAGQDDAAVAAKIGLSSEAVAAYHDLYFCVRAKLDAPIYVVTVAIGEKVNRGLTEDDRDLILKLIGYAKGPVLLQSLLDYYAAPLRLPGDLDRLSRLTPDEAKALLGKLSIKACLVALTAPGDERFLRLGPVLLDLADQLQIADRMRSQARVGLRIPEATIASCLRTQRRPPAEAAPSVFPAAGATAVSAAA